MKKMLLLSMLLHPLLQATPIIDEIAYEFIEKKDNVLVVKSDVAELLRNDGLFAETAARNYNPFHDTSTPISLNDATEQTQRTWFNKEWKHTASEEDRQKSARIAKGSQLLSSLHRTGINLQSDSADAIIAHAGVLPSVLKMLLAAEFAYNFTGAQTLYVVTANEPFNNDSIRKTPLDTYATAAQLLDNDHILPAVTIENQPQNEREVVALARQGFATQMPDLTINYVDKKDLSAFVQTFEKPTRVTVAASYPQLEAHMLTFALLATENPHFQVVSGVTCGRAAEFEPLYNTKESPEETYNFNRNNAARIFDRLAKYYKSVAGTINEFQHPAMANERLKLAGKLPAEFEDDEQ